MRDDCTKLVRRRDCIERNSKKYCKPCKKYARSEELINLQEDLEDHMDELTAVEIPLMAGDAHIDVASLFNEFIAKDLKNPGLRCWSDNLSSVRIPTLRRIAGTASSFGLDGIFGVIKKYIVIRRS